MGVSECYLGKKKITKIKKKLTEVVCILLSRASTVSACWSQYQIFPIRAHTAHVPALHSKPANQVGAAGGKGATGKTRLKAFRATKTHLSSRRGLLSNIYLFFTVWGEAFCKRLSTSNLEGEIPSISLPPSAYTKIKGADERGALRQVLALKEGSEELPENSLKSRISRNSSTQRPKNLHQALASNPLPASAIWR